MNVTHNSTMLVSLSDVLKSVGICVCKVFACSR